jgi:hypothetical protein
MGSVLIAVNEDVLLWLFDDKEKKKKKKKKGKERFTSSYLY